MLRKSLIAAIAVLVPLAMTAVADWNPGDPYTKWDQLPDLETTGLDINDTQIWLAVPPTGLSLADDWLCAETGPVTDFHIWYSWLNDDVGVIKQVRLAIYDDIPDPDGPGGPEYSMPGLFRWSKTFAPGDWAEVEYATNIKEGWYDPVTGQYISSAVPADTVCWQLNILVPEADAFIQEGDAAATRIYWLEVQVWLEDEGAAGTTQSLWGWKTSREHFQDDAVYWTSGGWQELRYPNGHLFETQSIDLAFALTTPEPATMGLLALGTFGLAALRRRRRK